VTPILLNETSKTGGRKVQGGEQRQSKRFYESREKRALRKGRTRKRRKTGKGKNEKFHFPFVSQRTNIGKSRARRRKKTKRSHDCVKEEASSDQEARKKHAEERLVSKVTGGQGVWAKKRKKETRGERGAGRNLVYGSGLIGKSLGSTEGSGRRKKLHQTSICLPGENNIKGEV